MENDPSGVGSVEESVSTAPPSFSVQVRGFDDAETATKVATLVGKIIRELGRYIRLQSLDPYCRGTGLSRSSSNSAMRAPSFAGIKGL